MDVHGITERLKRTLDPTGRSTAELELAEMQKIIGFCPFLLQVNPRNVFFFSSNNYRFIDSSFRLKIVMNESVELPVRQAGAIFFKNLVSQHWMEREYGKLHILDVPKCEFNSFSLTFSTESVKIKNCTFFFPPHGFYCRP